MNITRFTANEIINGAVRDVYTEVYAKVDKQAPSLPRKEKVRKAKLITRQAIQCVLCDRAFLNRFFD